MVNGRTRTTAGEVEGSRSEVQGQVRAQDGVEGGGASSLRWSRKTSPIGAKSPRSGPLVRIPQARPHERLRALEVGPLRLDDQHRRRLAELGEVHIQCVGLDDGPRPTRSVSSIPGSRNISATRGLTATLRRLSTRLLPGRSGRASRCSSRTLTNPARRTRGETSGKPSSVRAGQRGPGGELDERAAVTVDPVDLLVPDHLRREAVAGQGVGGAHGDDGTGPEGPRQHCAALADVEAAGERRPRHRGQRRSNRSRFITRSHAATKSRTNFSRRRSARRPPRWPGAGSATRRRGRRRSPST